MPRQAFEKLAPNFEIKKSRRKRRDFFVGVLFELVAFGQVCRAHNADYVNARVRKGR